MTDMGLWAGLNSEIVFWSAFKGASFSTKPSPLFVVIESSLLGRHVLAVLLTSPNAVRFAAAFRLPAFAIEDNAGLDLWR